MASDRFRCFGSFRRLRLLWPSLPLTNAAERGSAPGRPRLFRSALRLFRVASGQHDNKRDGDSGGHGASHLHGDVSAGRPHRHGGHSRLHAVGILSASKQNRAGGLFLRALPNSPPRREAAESNGLFLLGWAVFSFTPALCVLAEVLWKHHAAEDGAAALAGHRHPSGGGVPVSGERHRLATDSFSPNRSRNVAVLEASERKKASRRAVLSSLMAPGCVSR